MVDRVKAGDFKAAKVALESISDDGIGRIAKPFFAAWISLGIAGKLDPALAAMAPLSDFNGLGPVVIQHTALMEDQMGRTQQAVDRMKGAADGGAASARFIELYVEFLHRSGDDGDAKAFLDLFRSTNAGIAGAIAGALWVALAGWLRQYRGINETISSLLLAYVAIGLFKHMVEGPLRDPSSLNKPSTFALAEGMRIGGIGGSDVHWGLVIGVIACIASALWLRLTPSGFSVRVVGGNPRTAQLVGLPASRLILLACALGGAAAGLAGAVEVAAVHTSANASLIAGYGYAGILVAFIARQHPLAVIPVAILFGGFGAAGSLLQRRLGLPDASVLLLQGIAFVLILASEALRDVDWKAVWARLVKTAGPSPAQTAMGDKIA